jgi:BlaI family transcriptional regulator, penicillinase repressor
MENLKELTKAEEQAMQYLWEIGKGFVKDILEKYPDPKPNYNTVSTVIRLLEQKGFVQHKTYGNTHEYYPLVSKETYSHSAANKLISQYFGGSLKQLVSFFAQKDEVNTQDLDDIMKMIDKK